MENINTRIPLSYPEKKYVCVYHHSPVRMSFQQILPLLLCQKPPAVCVTVKAPCRRFCRKCVRWGDWWWLKKVSGWTKTTKVRVKDTTKMCGSFLGCSYKEKQAASSGQTGLGSGPAAHCRPHRRRSVYRVAPHLLPSIRRASLAKLDAPLLRATTPESGQKEGCEEQEPPTPSSDPISSGTPVPPPQHHTINVNNTPNSHLNQTQLLEVTWLFVYFVRRLFKLPFFFNLHLF